MLTCTLCRYSKTEWFLFFISPSQIMFTERNQLTFTALSRNFLNKICKFIKYITYFLYCHKLLYCQIFCFYIIGQKLIFAPESNNNFLIVLPASIDCVFKGIVVYTHSLAQKPVPCVLSFCYSSTSHLDTNFFFGYLLLQNKPFQNFMV